MKQLLLTVLGIVLSWQIVYAQNENVSLLVQSPHGKLVKMIWFLKEWNSEISGFDIRRKEGLQKDWVQMNKEAILPAISVKKDLTIVESDKPETERLKSVLFRYIQEHKVTQLETPDFLKKLNTDGQFLQDISKNIAADYDYALISGFAFIDHTATKKIDYEYALFIHGTDKLLAKASWNYGEIPDLNLITDITTKSVYKKRGIQIIWNVDLKKLKSGYVHGFNIYRDGIRLNQDDPVMIAYNNDLSQFEWFDSTANSMIPNQYSISSESFLDIEGIIKPYTYNPTDHPETYKKADITNITSLGYYFKEGIKINWDFPVEYEHFIKGFYIEKDNMPNGYKPVSSLLEPSARSFVDKTASPVSTYIRFRVYAIYKDLSNVLSNEMVYNYFPLREPPQPQNLKATTEIVNNKFKINFVWDAPMKGDTLTDYYQFYTLDPISNRLWLNTKIAPIRANKYTYEIASGSAGTQKFCITSTGKNKTESALSDTVFVAVPTINLPKPVITNATANSNIVTLQWQYAEIPDLKGFRVYKNKELIAGEKIVTKNAKEYITAPLKWDTKADFTIQAVSDLNMLSPISDSATVIIPLAPKKGR